MQISIKTNNSKRLFENFRNSTILLDNFSNSENLLFAHVMQMTEAQNVVRMIPVSFMKINQVILILRNKHLKFYTYLTKDL